MFGRLEAVLHSEIGSLGHPRAVLPGFAAAVLAYNVLAVLQRAVNRHTSSRSHPRRCPPTIWPCRSRGSYEGLLIAVPLECWPPWHSADPGRLAERLLHLARNINPRQVATNKRNPNSPSPKATSMAKPPALTSQSPVSSHRPRQDP